MASGGPIRLPSIETVLSKQSVEELRNDFTATVQEMLSRFPEGSDDHTAALWLDAFGVEIFNNRRLR